MLFTNCSHPELTAARRAMACEFSVTLSGSRTHLVAAACEALDEVECLEALLSVYREDSEVSRLNREAACGPVPGSEETYRLLRAGHRLSETTGGAFDLASGALSKAWGFFRGPRRMPDEPERTAALAASGYRHVILNDETRTVWFSRPGVEFNLGAIGKGYAIDRALALLRTRHGVRSALMQGGGSSIGALGTPAGEPRGWPVDLGDPLRPGRAVARVWLRGQALSTSAADHQFFVHQGRRYGHILDPRSGWPSARVLLSSCIAPTAAEADALSTAFFVMGEAGTRRWIAANPRFAAVLLVRSHILVIGKADIEVFS